MKILNKDFDFMSEVTDRDGECVFVYAVLGVFVGLLSFLLSIPTAALLGLLWAPIWETAWGVLTGLVYFVPYVAYPFLYARADFRNMPSYRGRQVAQKVQSLDSRFRTYLPSDIFDVIREMDAHGDLYGCTLERDVDRLLSLQRDERRVAEEPQNELYRERRDELLAVVRREADVHTQVAKELQEGA